MKTRNVISDGAPEDLGSTLERILLSALGIETKIGMSKDDVWKREDVERRYGSLFKDGHTVIAVNGVRQAMTVKFPADILKFHNNSSFCGIESVLSIPNDLLEEYRPKIRQIIDSICKSKA